MALRNCFWRKGCYEFDEGPGLVEIHDFGIPVKSTEIGGLLEIRNWLKVSSRYAIWSERSKLTGMSRGTGPTIHLCLVDVLNFWKHPKVDNLSTRPLGIGNLLGVGRHQQGADRRASPPFPKQLKWNSGLKNSWKLKGSCPTLAYSQHGSWRTHRLPEARELEKELKNTTGNPSTFLPLLKVIGRPTWALWQSDIGLTWKLQIGRFADRWFPAFEHSEGCDTLECVFWVKTLPSKYKIWDFWIGSCEMSNVSSRTLGPHRRNASRWNAGGDGTSKMLIWWVEYFFRHI